MPGLSKVIKGSKLRHTDGKCQLFCFLRGKLLCLSVCAKHPCRLSKHSLRRLAVHLHDFLSGGLSGIGYGNLQGYLLFCHTNCLCFRGKFRIGKPEAERIQHPVLRKGFKITVADINVFLVRCIVYGFPK